MGGSEFGRRPLLIGRSCSDRRGSPPEPEPADSSVRADDKTDVTDRLAQGQLGLAVQMSVMRTKLQHRQEALQIQTADKLISLFINCNGFGVLYFLFNLENILPDV